jgi:hypothetical protein
MNIERENIMTVIRDTAGRPVPGTTVTLEATPTRYNPVAGQTPLGHHIGSDGKLWNDAKTVTITRVRKTRAGYNLATDDGFALRVAA